ncbi:GATA zinc finger domain-containing protein 14 [Eupeodes corollae]|uniref:GATA zinc finger domain-containing protein 14 n=1 Tax=Eupeodes corollae TaxID=290404 RepID=UPI0024938CC7|nr:GATA zinc finger domain-containing protein 14 [Eupeodes corollae]XP_055916328.1 GATA zinc finger domain-containing protein 14 [Eupeodes corollae]
MDIQHVSSGSMMAPTLDTPSKYGRDQKYVYKKSSYQSSYSNTDGNIGNSFSSNTEQNVNQLDALLEDLKNEREQTREKDIHTSSTTYKTIEPTGTVTKTTRIVKSHQLPIEVENVTAYSSYSSSDDPNSTMKDIMRNDISYKSNKSLSKNVNTSTVFDTTSSSHSENNVLVPMLLENDSKSLHLSDDILPIPGTKVTTTVRTYTYEIPADNNTINNRTVLYKNNVHNSSRNEFISEPNLPQTVVYSSESYNNSSNGPNNPNIDRQVGVNSTNRIYEINESQDYRTQRNEHLVSQPIQPTSKTIVYNINKTEHNTSTIQGPPFSPNNVPSHTLLPQRPQQSPHYPNGSTNNYYYRESTNTVNTINGSPGDNLHPNVTIEYPRDNYGPKDNYVPQNTSVTYDYSSSTINSRRGPNYDSPTSQPPPFPVDGVVYPDTTGRPPAQLNELLDSFGEDNVDSKLVDTSHRPKREIETALATTNQQTIPSVNKAGPAVYYPPGHDMLTKKEESMSGGYAASGKYAKASGMYEYESGYKSKSSSKSGAAVVPVCLPLCCAMPCSIM